MLFQLPVGDSRNLRYVGRFEAKTTLVPYGGREASYNSSLRCLVLVTNGVTFSSDFPKRFLYIMYVSCT